MDIYKRKMEIEWLGVVLEPRIGEICCTMNEGWNISRYVRK